MSTERSLIRPVADKKPTDGTTSQEKDSVPPTGISRPHRGIHRKAVRAAVGIERAIVLGDLHIPFHDERAVALSLAIVREMKPEHLFFNGDIIDMYAISRFSKDPARALMLQQDLDQTVEVLHEYKKASPLSELVFIRGNHEARLQTYLHDRAPELSGLRGLSLPSLLSLDKLGITYVAGRGKSACTHYGSVAVGHFDRCSVHSAFTAKALVDARGESLVQGHIHRLGIHYKTLPGGRMLGGFEGGCLCDMNPEYVTDPNWQQGLVVITKRTDTDRFHVTQIPFIDWEALVNDVLYSA